MFHVKQRRMDYHLHTVHSFDGRQTIQELCESTLRQGVEEICLTEHIEPGHPDASVDYIHGAGDLEQLCAERHGTGVLMPALSKDGFFAFVAKKGALPRKSFSMGEAYEKRYYLETAEL